MTNMTVPSLLPPPHHTTVVHIAVHDRAAADLRGAAGRAARRHKVTRPLKRSDRALARSSSQVATLHHRAGDVAVAGRRAELAHAGVPAGAHPRIRPRTVNLLVALMALCDALLVSAALQHADEHVSPLVAIVLALGIGTALVALGKKLGHELATFERLRDQSARWGVIVALTTVIVVVAAVGLTLLRLPSTAAWPFLALAVPSGSAALTWYGYDPPQAAAIDAERRLADAGARARRANRRATASLARHLRLRDLGERRLRALLAPALRRATADGLVTAASPHDPRRTLDALVAATLPEPRIDAGSIEAARGRALEVAGIASLPAPHALDAGGG